MASSTESDLELGASRRWSEGPAPARPLEPHAENKAKQHASPDARRPDSDPDHTEQEDQDGLPGENPLTRWIRDSQSWLSSLIVHMMLLIILALWALPGTQSTSPADLQLTDQFSNNPELIPDILPDLDETPEVEVVAPAEIASTSSSMDLEQLSVTPADDLAAAAAPDFSDDATEFASSFLEQAADFAGSALSGRGMAARATLVRAKGGTKESEEAVAMALAWLAAHQFPNGAWSFDHRLGPCRGRCSAPGTVGTAVNGATAIALLPFLGAGHTHLEGTYKENVKQGMYFLTQAMKVSRTKGGELWEEGGRMYSHGLGAIALCECYGMTRDRALAEPAQLSLNFIHYAQDPLRGGWRYYPQKDSDTSVVGWQVMALKSGHMAYLQVNPATVRKAYLFLDYVQGNGGASYGYSAPGGGTIATSAVGLLCRMYLGWKRDNPALGRGIEQLVLHGPDKANMYFNYYATQAIFQYTGGTGSLWREWNDKMREFLISSQIREGHEKGSWYLPGDGHNASGGRLYVTAMATMILEIYYRHMPIYQEKAVEEEFPE